MDAFTERADQTGVPVNSNIATPLAHVFAMSNVPGVALNESTTGQLEFWGHCYHTGDDPADVLFDHNDVPSDADCPSLPNCYGSMQVHADSQTLFAYNGWSRQDSLSDLGIGANTGAGHPDWTYAQNADGYGVRDLGVYLRLASFWRTPDPTELATTGVGETDALMRVAYDNHADTSWQPSLREASEDDYCPLPAPMKCVTMEFRLRTSNQLTGFRILSLRGHSPSTVLVERLDYDSATWTPTQTWSPEDSSSW